MTGKTRRKRKKGCEGRRRRSLKLYGYVSNKTRQEDSSSSKRKKRKQASSYLRIGINPSPTHSTSSQWSNCCTHLPLSGQNHVTFAGPALVRIIPFSDRKSKSLGITDVVLALRKVRGEDTDNRLGQHQTTTTTTPRLHGPPACPFIPSQFLSSNRKLEFYQ